MFAHTPARRSWLCAVAVIAVGCPNNPRPPMDVVDASFVDGADVALVDSVDAVDRVHVEAATVSDAADVPDGWTGTTPVFGACGTDGECAWAEGVTCLSTFPGGLCSRRCNTAADCGASATCEFNLCLPSCTSGDGDCARWHGACETYFDLTTACAPVCFATDRTPPGEATCPSGTTCDVYANACVVTPVTAGADNGAPCHGEDECLSGLCVLDYVDADGLPSGYVDGYCMSYGLMPSDGAPTGVPIPQSSCPDGSVVDPFYEPGDFAPCLRACTADSDCRAGYECDHYDTTNPPGYPNGTCDPIDCSQAGRTCPTGSTCTTVDGEGVGHCGVGA